MNRAVSVSELYNTNFNQLDFNGPFFDLIGKPELKGAWMIWGHSGNGKTRFALQLAKYLAQFTRVAYDSMEEGVSLSIKKAFIETGMEAVKGRVILLDKEPILDLYDRLEKRKSPNVVIIDSIQYSGLNYKQYKALIDTFRNKLFIFISHADGKNPAGAVAKSARYDAFVKIWVEGYKATASSRYSGNSKDYVIWDKGYYDFWGETNN